MVLALIVASILGLLAGPLLLKLPTKWKTWQDLLDGFVLVTVGGISLLHLLPEALGAGGWVAFVFMCLGALLPTWFERKAASQGGGLSSLILLLGLVPHAAIENAALGSVSESQMWALGLAIVAHRLPVGMVLYSTISRRFGNVFAWGGIGILVLASIAGLIAGDVVTSTFSGRGVVWLQAMVGGSLLHVVFSAHRHGLEDAQAPVQKKPYYIASTLGALLGAGITYFALTSVHHHHHHHKSSLEMGEMFLTLAMRCAPALVVAYILVALMRWAGGAALLKLKPVGTLIVAMCLSVPLFGVTWTILRAAAAFLVVLGLWRFGDRKALCVTDEQGGWFDVFDQTMPWVVLGLILASAMEPLLSYDHFAQLPQIIQVPLFAILGVPLFFSATGSSPMIAVVIHKGLSPGAGLAFLVTGPMLGVVMLGQRRVVLVLAIVVLSVMAGYVVDMLPIQVLADLHHGMHDHGHAHDVVWAWYEWTALVVLVLMLLGSMVRQGPRGMIERVTPGQDVSK